jgi:hypothetical protein
VTKSTTDVTPISIIIGFTDRLLFRVNRVKFSLKMTTFKMRVTVYIHERKSMKEVGMTKRVGKATEAHS